MSRSNIRHSNITAYFERLWFAKLLRVADPRSVKAPSPLRSAGALHMTSLLAIRA